MIVSMIEREITPRLTALFNQYPVVTVTGPRQSGKTTLCRAAFPHLQYLNLETPEVREFAESDPRGFLAQSSDGSIIDEVQNVPELLSYIQVDVDERGQNGLFVLTGSEQFRLSKAVSQSLAGRTALLRLLPFSMAERARAGVSMASDDMIASGFYPRIVVKKLDPHQALGDYFETYVERDIRRSNEIRNISSFRRFVRLCAGRVGQLVNLSSLGADAGISHTTAREWLTILEASYIVFQLPPFHANIKKRLIKSPKFYFYDVGLASYLIGIESARQVSTHPLRGALFENVVVTEAVKHRYNRGRHPRFSFFRESNGLECDLLCETGRGISAIEIKSGATVSRDYFSSLNKVVEILPNIVSRTVVYGGGARNQRNDCAVVPLSGLGAILDRMDADHALATFIDERRSSVPAVNDIKTLDSAFGTLIRPTLDGVEPYCSRLGGGLFRTLNQQSKISRGATTTQSSLDSLLPARWEATKDQYILSPGFALGDEQGLAIGAEFWFSGYTGNDGRDFGLKLSIEWSFGASSVIRRVMLDSAPITELDVTIEYPDIAATQVDADKVIAEVVKALLDRIAELSTA